MKCQKCSQTAIINNPELCQEHVVEFVEKTVVQTIKDYQLFTTQDKICVALSGGKDSLTLAHILHKLAYDISGLAIDEGISDYREHTLTTLKSFCKQRNIPLHISSFAQEIGKPLDDMVEGRHPCSVCGVFRRYLLNKHAHTFDVIATGHNLDDEAQVVLMNLIKANKDLYRTHLRTPPAKGFVPRVKPLMFVPEKLVRAYTLIQGFDAGFDECPYVQQSLRAQVRDTLNEYESKQPGMKERLVKAALAIATEQKNDLKTCEKCGEPSPHLMCRSCELKEELGLLQ